MEKISLGPHSYVLVPKSLDSQSKTKGFAYCRCSTDYQVKDNGSIDVQIKLISDYCERQGITITGFYIDEALSGKQGSNERPALQYIESHIKKGDALVCMSVSRLGRNLAFTSALLERMTKKNVAVHVTEIGNITGDASDIFNMMGFVAAIESRNTGKRVSAAMQHLKAKGELKTRPRFGETHGTDKREYIEDPAAIKVIEYLRELRLTEPEISYREMARKLNEEFDPSVFKKTTWRGPDIKRYSVAHGIPLKAET